MLPRPSPSRENGPVNDIELKPAPDTMDEAREEDPGLRFDDAYWDDAFCSWGDPTLRTCCS